VKPNSTALSACWLRDISTNNLTEQPMPAAQRRICECESDIQQQIVLMELTVLFLVPFCSARRSEPEEIGRLIAIDVEAAQNLNRANFPLKS
jgi:hypothetical protein